jgi:hypothetical protein
MTSCHNPEQPPAHYDTSLIQVLAFTSGKFRARKIGLRYLKCYLDPVQYEHVVSDLNPGDLLRYKLSATKCAITGPKTMIETLSGLLFQKYAIMRHKQRLYYILVVPYGIFLPTMDARVNIPDTFGDAVIRSINTKYGPIIRTVQPNSELYRVTRCKNNKITCYNHPHLKYLYTIISRIHIAHTDTSTPTPIEDIRTNLCLMGLGSAIANLTILWSSNSLDVQYP